MPSAAVIAFSVSKLSDGGTVDQNAGVRRSLRVSRQGVAQPERAAGLGCKFGLDPRKIGVGWDHGQARDHRFKRRFTERITIHQHIVESALAHCRRDAEPSRGVAPADRRR